MKGIFALCQTIVVAVFVLLHPSSASALWDMSAVYDEFESMGYSNPRLNFSGMSCYGELAVCNEFKAEAVSWASANLADTISSTPRESTRLVRSYTYAGKTFETWAVDWTVFYCYPDDYPKPTYWRCGKKKQDLVLNITAPEQIKPSYLKGTRRGKKSTGTIKLSVNNANGEPESGVEISLTIKALLDSGGHDHDSEDSNRPHGLLSGTACVSCVNNVATVRTNEDGEAELIYEAPQVSGKYIIEASCTPECKVEGDNNIKVAVPNLVSLEDTAYLDLIGVYPTSKHKDTHYLNSKVLKKIYKIATKYRKKFPNAPVLKFNDASLKWGGKFDISGKWEKSVSHKTHREGKNIDVRANPHMHSDAIPHANFLYFEGLVEEFGGKALLELYASRNGWDHYHLTFK